LLPSFIVDEIMRTFICTIFFSGPPFGFEDLSNEKDQGNECKRGFS
jgi:hypothetical protein